MLLPSLSLLFLATQQLDYTIGIDPGLNTLTASVCASPSLRLQDLIGIEESARFFLSEDLEQAYDILDKHRVAWVFAYDSDRVAQNSTPILNEPVPWQPLGRILDLTPSQAPPFLVLSAQNPTCKLYRVALER